MDKLAFAYPIKPGQFERLMQHQQEVLSKTEAHVPHADEIGITCVRMYHQTTPIEAIIIYMEGENIAFATDRSEHGGKEPHDMWVSFFEEVTGGHSQPDMPAVLLDWSRDSGHAVGTA